MKRGEVFPSDYLKCEDLNRKDLTLTIKDVSSEKMGQEEKRVAWFYKTEKGLVLNQTNWNTIADLCGDDDDHWQGKSITLFPSKTKYQGRTVDCIRVREEAPAASNGPAARTNGGKRNPAVTQAEAEWFENAGSVQGAMGLNPKGKPKPNVAREPGEDDDEDSGY